MTSRIRLAATAAGEDTPVRIVSLSPTATDMLFAIGAGDKVVAVDDQSNHPQDGRATAAVLAGEVGAGMEVVDVGVGRPTGGLVEAPALDDVRFDECWHAGQRGGALPRCRRRCPLRRACRGLGRSGHGRGRRRAGPEAGRGGRPVERVSGAAPLEVLRHCGGAELVAMAPATVEARRRAIPVVLDGFVNTTAVATLEPARAGALDHCIAGHRSPEPGHRLPLERLGKEPLLDLGLRLGEGSGALLAAPLVRMAVAAVVEVAAFEEWGVA